MAGKDSPYIVDAQSIAQGQKLPGVGQGGAVLPLGDSLIGYRKAQHVQAGGQLGLVHPQLLPAPGYELSYIIIHKITFSLCAHIINYTLENCNSKYI